MNTLEKVQVGLRENHLEIKSLRSEIGNLIFKRFFNYLMPHPTTVGMITRKEEELKRKLFEQETLQELRSYYINNE